jgi:carboxymethylenebutenolidase
MGAAKLPAGFAMAADPIPEQAIHTAADGLDAGEASIPADDREIPAYRARRTGGRDLPVVLVVQEIFGVHEYIKDVCRRLAHAGYLAIAPDLYVRHGDPAKMADWNEIRAKVVSKVPDKQVMSDLDAAVRFAAADGGDVNRLAITGFCWGGRIVWLYAAHSAQLKAGVAWYGKIEAPRDELHPRMPIDIAGELKCPVLGLYGAKDESIPISDVGRMREAAKASESEIHVYGDAGHGFHADYRPHFHRAAAEDGWERMKAWFAQHLR